MRSALDLFDIVCYPDSIPSIPAAEGRRGIAEAEPRELRGTLAQCLMERIAPVWAEIERPDVGPVRND